MHTKTQLSILRSIQNPVFGGYIADPTLTQSALRRIQGLAQPRGLRPGPGLNPMLSILRKYAGPTQHLSFSPQNPLNAVEVDKWVYQLFSAFVSTASWPYVASPIFSNKEFELCRPHTGRHCPAVHSTHSPPPPPPDLCKKDPGLSASSAARRATTASYCRTADKTSPNG